MESECQAGLFCADVCTPICCPDNQQPCNSGSCNVELHLDSGKGFVVVCSFNEQCTLLTKNACPKGFDCHLQDTNTGLSTCMPPSDMQVDEGGSCFYLNDCKDMQFCYGMHANEPGNCRWNCRLSDKNKSAPGLGGCPKGQTCQAFDLGVPDVGLCLPN
jgi:hypothetical protein